MDRSASDPAASSIVILGHPRKGISMSAHTTSLIRFACAGLLVAGALVLTEPGVAADTEGPTARAPALDHCKQECGEAASERYHSIWDAPSWLAFYTGCVTSCVSFHS